MSIGFTAAELALIRSDIVGLLPDTCNILQATETSDSMGYLTQSWGTVTGGTAVSCRFDYKSGRENLNSAALMPYAAAVVSMAYDGTVTTQNRLEFGSNIYGIVSVNTDQSWVGVKRVMVELVK